MLKLAVAFVAGLTTPITVPAVIDVAGDVVESVEDYRNSGTMMGSSNTSNSSNVMGSGMMTQEEMNDMMNGSRGHCHDDYVVEPELITPEVDVIE